MLKQLINHKKFQIIKILLAAGIGFIVFCIIYGIKPLNPTNDKWIMTGYDEADIIKHYAGWLAFRNSEWSFPLGLANKMAVGEGTLISYTDSIPWIAIIFKILENILPETFQYFGIYIFACFGLQSIAAFKIMLNRTHNIYFSYLGTVIFCFSPIFLERNFRHTALGSHWLILFSILFYLEHKDNHSAKYYIYFAILEMLAIGIHPYFLPMIAIFSLLCVIEDLKYHRLITIIYFLVQLLSTYLIGYLIGVLGNKISKSRWGYGHFSMNLNALMNPTSAGKYTWSKLLKVRPQILGNYDGFNYLGAGVLISILILIIAFLVFKPWLRIMKTAGKYHMLILACCLLTMFAISNVITYNDKILLSIPLPSIINEICGIFRASSRMFYPVYYLIFLLILCVIWNAGKKINKTSPYILLLCLTVIQLIDLSTVINQKHTGMNKKCLNESILDDDLMHKIALDSDSLILDNFNNVRVSIDLATWALKNKMGTYYSVSTTSGAYEVTSAIKNEILETVKNTHEIGEYIIATTDFNTLIELSTIDNIAIYKYKDAWLVFKNNSAMEEVKYVDSREKYTVANLTDDNWEKGISKDGYCLLFKFSDKLLLSLKTKKTVMCSGNAYSIRDVTFDQDWIHVYVDQIAEECKYPAQLVLEQYEYNISNDMVTVVNLTDDNWTKGISLDKKRLLFCYSDQLLMRIWNADAIMFQDKLYMISDKTFNNKWITVTVNEDASLCEYPTQLVFCK